VISARIASGGEFLLLGPVRGLSAEVPPLLAAIDEFRPDALGLGLSADEMKALTEYFVRSEADPVVPLTSNEASEVRGLSRFGEVRVPNPSYVEILRWTHGSALPVTALDPSDERTASLFTEHISYVELVRRTVNERAVSRHPPASTTADDFALDWDRKVAGGRGSRDFAAARDRYLVRGARRLAGGHWRVAVVVDRERFEHVRGLLGNGPDSATEDD
jgi:hypothetical protein